MPFVSVTRLRIRRLRFLPFFALHAQQSLTQVRAATGFQGGSLLPDRRWTFWTLTVWDHSESMRAYMLNGSHRAAMPRLTNWCDEASVVHWDSDVAGLPSWEEATTRMKHEGRPSKLRHPSAGHGAMQFAEPRLSRTAAIRPKLADAGS
jgi:Domain of unknown function (DUF3291)